MTGADIIAVIILTALAIAIAVYLLHWLYRRSSKEVSFVRTGLGGEKGVLNGGAFVLPIIHNITTVGMRTLRVEIVAEFYVRVSPTAASVSIAAGSLGQRTLEPDSLRELVQGRFVDALGIVAAKMTMEEMQENRGDYIKSVKVLVAESLSETGLVLEAVSLTSLDQASLDVFNPSNVFDAEGLTQLTEQIETRKKKRNDIEQDTTIKIRSKNLETEQKALEIDKQREFARLKQEREIAKQKSKEQTEIATEQATQEQLAEASRIKSHEEIEKARISQQDTIEVERSLREHELTMQVEERKKLRNEIERQTEIEIKQKNLETDIRSLEIDRENEFARLDQEEQIAKRRAQQKADVMKEESERYRESEQAQLKAQESVKKLKIEQQRSIETSRIENEEKTQTREIEKRKALQMEEHDRDLAVTEKLVLVLKANEVKEQARAQTEMASEQVGSAREIEIAQRKKTLHLIRAQQEGESEAIHITTVAKAEKEASQEREQAEKFTSLATQLRYEVDAAGKLLLNDAENQRSDASRQSDLKMRIAENLDSIIREAVRPMETIDGIKIYEVNGLPGIGGRGDFDAGAGGSGGNGTGGNLSDSVVNSALRYRAQVPFVDNLLNEIGMSSGEIGNIKNILGDYNTTSDSSDKAS